MTALSSEKPKLNFYVHVYVYGLNKQLKPAKPAHPAHCEQESMSG
jgi:hypothetical protein